METDEKKVVRLIMTRELYEAVRRQAQEEFRTVPKEIVQILREKFHVR